MVLFFAIIKIIMEDKIRARIFAEGIVQGVFFRENTRQKADELGILGWVRNLPDGRVEIVIEGEKQKVEKMIKWIEKGYKFAKVEKIDIKLEKFNGEFQNFKIRYNSDF